MAESLKFLALVALLLLGSGGWGTTTVAALRRAGWEGARDEIGPPLQVVLGVALFLAVGGFFVAFQVAWLSLLLFWHFLGVALLLARLAWVARAPITITWNSVVAVAATTAAGLVLILMSLGTALGASSLPSYSLGAYNPYDDDAAYVYLAKKLIDTGGLIDPFNLRRLTGYGGSTLYHSIFFGVSGNSSLRGFEFMFAALLLVLVAVWDTRRRWLAVSVLFVGLGVLLGHGAGPIANLSPDYSVAVLSLATYQLLRKIPDIASPEQPLRYVIIGVLLAGILTLRVYFITAVVIATLIVIISIRGRRSIKGLAIITGTSAVAISGWAVALLRSSGTPLFPLIAGNYNTSSPSGADPSVHGFRAYAQLFLDAFNGYDVGAISLVCGVLAVSCLVFTTWQRRRMLVLFAASVGSLVQLAVLTYIFVGADTSDIVRWQAPSTLAVGLLAINTLLPRRDRERTGRSTGRLPSSQRVPTVPTLSTSLLHFHRRVATAIVMLVLLLGVSSLTFGDSISVFAHDTSSSLQLGRRVLQRSLGLADRYGSLRKEYSQLNSMVPQGARVLAAVDYPALLDGAKYDLATLDEAGSASPPPHMPFFRGATAKVRYLRHLGYQYIVVDSPNSPGLYQLGPFLDVFRIPVYFIRAQVPYYIDWWSTVFSLEKSGRYSVRHAGQLSLIKIS